MIDWQEIKFRASGWGNLLTEPVTKAAKEAGELSITCQKELIKIYNRELYGRKKDITTKQMDKGKLVEKDSAALLISVEKYPDNVSVIINDGVTVLDNDYFIGTPDIFIMNGGTIEICDIKSSWELDTFMPKLVEEPDKSYVAQLNVYYELAGASGGFIAYCLVDAPESILFQESEFLLRNGSYISKESPDYLIAWEEKKKLMIFEDIDYRERVIKIPVPRNDELIQKMKDKVPILRNWLQEFHKKHMNQYPK